MSLLQTNLSAIDYIRYEILFLSKFFEIMRFYSAAFVVGALALPAHLALCCSRPKASS